MPRTKHMLRMVALGVVLLLALVGLHGTALAGTTITVNTTADELNSDGDCSLREAIQAANTDAAVDACPAGSGDDTITLPAGTYTLSIAGTGEDSNATGDLNILTNLTINGAGADATIIDGGAIDRVLHIPPSSTSLEIMGATVQNGSSDSDGGGIFNFGTLILIDSTVINNTSILGDGGGINNRSGGTLTMIGSTVINNTANLGGGISNRQHRNHDQQHGQRQPG